MKNSSLNMYFFLLHLFFLGCSSNIVEEHLKGEIMIESIPAKLIGQTALADSIFFLIKPFSNQELLEAWNINSGIKLYSGGTMGGGPNQIALPPFLIGLDQKHILLYDMRKILLFDKNDLSEVKVLNIPFDANELSKIISIGNDQYLGFNLSSNYPFLVFDSIQLIDKFGNFPINNSIVSNKQKVFQGTIYFNSSNELFLYASSDIGYFAVYNINNNYTKKVLERKYYDIDYQMINNNLIWQKDNIRGAVDGIITNDYIVLLIFDGAKSGFMVNDYETTPQTLLVFDLKGVLLKKVQLDKKVLRLANAGKDNILYCIGFNPDFCLVKYQL